MFAAIIFSVGLNDVCHNLNRITHENMNSNVFVYIKRERMLLFGIHSVVNEKKV